MPDMDNLKRRLHALRAEALAILAEIEADDHPDPETGQTKEQLAHMGWPLKGDAEPYDNPPETHSG
jgi:hypothetical protein